MKMQQPKKNRGISLISAIFLMVVIMLLAGYSLNLTSSQQAGTTLTMQSLRAWYAAKGGIEWTLFQVNAGACPAIPSTYTVDGFSVEISRCDVYPINEGGNSYNLYDVVATASQGSVGSVGHVRRTIRATFSN